MSNFPNQFTRGYSSEEGDAIRKWFAEGYSASNISKMLMKYFNIFRSRNSVIGYKHRNKIPTPEHKKPIQRTYSPRNTYRRSSRNYSSARKARAGYYPPPAKSVVDPQKLLNMKAPDPLNLSLMDLKEHQCRYAVTEDHPFVFCGNDKYNDSSWCEYHYMLCYR